MTKITSYIKNIVVTDTDCKITRSKKKPGSALSSLKAISNDRIQSKEHAKEIQKAAEEIFTRYEKKRNSYAGKVKTYIYDLLKKHFRVSNTRNKKYLNLHSLYKKIILKCENTIKADDADPIKDDNSRPYLNEIKEIKKLYCNDLLQELERLRNFDILTEEIETMLDTKFLQCRGVEPSSANNANEVKVAIGRAMEIKRIVEKTHYVFIHGQDTRWLAISYLIKEAVRENYDMDTIKLYKFLRVPSSEKCLLSDIVSKANVAMFDYSAKVRAKLISVDVLNRNALSNSAGESAFSYLSSNTSAFTNEDLTSIKKCVKSVISELTPVSSLVTRHKLNHAVDKAMAKMRNARIGNLVIICIPKTLTETPETNVQYRCHEYGVPCNCELKQLDDNVILDLLHEDLKLGEIMCHSGSAFARPPQYRLIAQLLRPEDGILTFIETPIRKKIRHEFKEELRKILS